MVATPLHLRTLLQVSAQIRRQEVSSVEVTTALLDRIAGLDGLYHAYATVLEKRALEQAERADKRSVPTRRSRVDNGAVACMESRSR